MYAVHGEKKKPIVGANSHNSESPKPEGSVGSDGGSIAEDKTDIYGFGNGYKSQFENIIMGKQMNFVGEKKRSSS